MKKRILILALIIVSSTALMTGCPDITNTTKTSTSSMTYTTLKSPFNGDGNWYLTQAFDAYNSDYNGHHPAEDWNYASGDSDAGKPVYAIAAGAVIDWGPVFQGDTNGAKGGFYIIVRHDGNFKIPASNGAHILSLSQPR